MKKQIACPKCSGRGYRTVITGDRNDYCGVANEKCAACNGTGAQLVDMTNAERIRAMSDEELCEFLMCDVICDQKISPECGDCEKCVMDWLQQPAKEDTDGN